MTDPASDLFSIVTQFARTRGFIVCTWRGLQLRCLTFQLNIKQLKKDFKSIGIRKKAKVFLWRYFLG